MYIIHCSELFSFFGNGWSCGWKTVFSLYNYADKSKYRTIIVGKSTVVTISVKFRPFEIVALNENLQLPVV